MSRYQSKGLKGQRKRYRSTVGSGILECNRLLKVALLHLVTVRFD